LSPLPLRLVIVDDQRLFAEGLKSILTSRDPGLDVVGIAATGVEAVELVLRLKPDVVLMDVQMPEMDGLEATRLIHEAEPEQRVMMLTTYDDDEYVKAALRHGAIGYLLKDASVGDLIGALRSALERSVILAPSVAQNLANPTKSHASPAAPLWLSRLGPKEKQILKLMQQGCNNYDISRRLNLGEQTVKNYISGIYAKTEVHDRFLLMKAADGVDLDTD